MEISESWLWEHLPAGGGVALDVGANHGEWTRWLAPRFGEVYAVEPNPALGEELRGIGANVHVLPVGAWERAEWRSFTLFERDVHTSALGEWDGINGGPPVGYIWLWCMPIDEMPIEGKVDFIKMDIEAAEAAALRGAARTIEHDRPRMIVEIHSGANGEAVGAMLRGWGYRWVEVRHPWYREGDRFWDRHFWMICEPLAGQDSE